MKSYSDQFNYLKGNMEIETDTFEILDISKYDTHGFCPNFPLGKLKYERLAAIGCYEARSDWIQYIGPVAEFGGCNPINGHFATLVLALCKPERLQLVAYVIECM
jgi:hypothetical protein